MSAEMSSSCRENAHQVLARVVADSVDGTLVSVDLEQGLQRSRVERLDVSIWSGRNARSE